MTANFAPYGDSTTSGRPIGKSCSNSCIFLLALRKESVDFTGFSDSRLRVQYPIYRFNFNSLIYVCQQSFLEVKHNELECIDFWNSRD